MTTGQRMEEKSDFTRTDEAQMPTEPSSEALRSDLFRRKERAIKAFMKIKLAEVHGGSRKRSWYDQQQHQGHSESAEEFCWEAVFDCRKTSSSHTTLIKELESCCSSISHICSSKTKIYSVNHCENGLYLLSSALCPDQQIYWARLALEGYSTVEHTNLTNLSRLYDSHDPSVSRKPTEAVESHHDLNNLWQKSLEENNNFATFNKLRWSCLGYHYDWTMRSYRRNLKSEFPLELAQFTKKISSSVENDFEPEAAIVNFYPLNTNMGGHLDDAEHDLSKPIVSISIGRSAIFLIGGKLKSVDALPILVRSGDVIIMSDESRLCYHGVPAIIPIELERLLCENNDPDLDRCETNDPSTSHIFDYLQDHRINMNIRQVRIDCSSDENWVEKSGTGHVKYAP